MYKKVIVIISIVLFGAGSIFMGCVKKEEIKDPEIKKQMKLIDEMKIKRENRTRELKEMDGSKLVQDLSNESQRGLEPFNSMAYKEAVSRGSKVVPELSSALKLTEKPFLLGLLALRTINPDEYKKLEPGFRIKPLIDALESAKFFNAFGVPHLYWEEAAKAIIEEGEGAKEYLVPLLKNTRMAPVWGSEGTITNKIYQYRVCDYAWKMLLDIDKKEVEVSQDASVRDSLFSEYTEK